MRKLYRFYWDWDRMGEVTGLFVEEDSVIEKAIGEEVYFGEILGKHSEISGTLEMDDLTIVTEDQEFISMFESIVGSEGYNPIDYI